MKRFPIRTTPATTAAIVLPALVLLAIGTGAGYWLARTGSGATGADAPAPATTDADGRRVLYWYDPMVPDQHFDKPGKSPFMDMELVPRYADESGSPGVRIDPGVRQNLGIRTAVVEVGRLAAGINVPGTLDWDLRSESLVSLPVPAIVSRLHVRAPYQRVAAGTPLATVLAPEWGTALAEARALADAGSADARALQSAARQRLRMLGLAGTTASAGGAVTLRAPRAGVVREVLAREGYTAMAGAPLFRINGTGTVWLLADVPQAATQGLAPGTPVVATIEGIAGREFRGEVETLLPEVDTATRTRRARIVLRNEEGLLAPGMFAQVALQAGAGEPLPLVPTEALVATGEDTRVLVARGEDGFDPVRVRTGSSAGGRTEILEGLRGGERVVTSGQFLVDSEASLSGALERLGAPAQADAEADPHAGHDMPAAPAERGP